ncbi:unnamed protein product [Pelagomonas calceolata]|uniref:Uncharacterized protein n=1 Tax=Pelagomonas calceolata TaxID=35677 RepID=A0A8J2X7D8_9STRA|nr:unnamed protein product [Pelagomonas calceolata]
MTASLSSSLSTWRHLSKMPMSREDTICCQRAVHSN